MNYKKIMLMYSGFFGLPHALSACDRFMNYTNGRVMLINDTKHLIKTGSQQAFENEAIEIKIGSKQLYTVIVPGSMLRISFQHCEPKDCSYVTGVKLSELIAAGKKLSKKTRLTYPVTDKKELVVKYTPLIGPFCEKE